MQYIDYDKLTGKGIKIAIIDSGIDLTHELFKRTKINGCCIYLNEEGQIIFGKDYNDNIGHGTACAGIIVKKSPEVELLIIKVFDRKLNVSSKIVVEAIKYAIEQRVDIINLSLGTTEENSIDELKKVCDYAEKLGVLIVCAESNNGVTSYPAAFNNVISVSAGKVRGKYDYYINKNRDNHSFVCRGDKQRVSWTNPKYIFIGGTSFAAPHMTAIISLILQSGVKKDFKHVVKFLKENAKQGSVDIVYENINYLDMVIKRIKKKDFDWINKAAIFPFNKEMHTLISFREDLGFEITNVCDIRGRGLKGKDTGEIMNMGKNGIIIFTDFEESIKNVDTVIIGHLEELSEILNEDLLYKYLEISIDNGKNVFSFSSLDKPIYADLKKEANKKGLIIEYPKVDNEELNEYKEIYPYIKSKRPKAPIVGIFGTSSNQGKFTCQLVLRKKLIEKGYKVGQLGTEHHSKLFGIDEVFPMGYSNSVKLPIDSYITYVDYLIKKISLNNPEIIIAGSQSGTIPYLLTVEPKDTYTLRSIAFLMGINADAFILTVNSIDPIKYIEDTINVIRAIGKAEVILLSMSKLEKKVYHEKGGKIKTIKKMDIKEYQKKKEYLENYFKIPVVDVLDKNDAEVLVETVIDYLSSKHEVSYYGVK